MTRITTTKLVATALAVASLGAGSLGTADSAEAKVSKNTISIQAQQGGFFGYVESRNEACEGERNVVLFKQTGRKQNLRRDKRVGSDLAQPDGDGSMWSISTNQRGKFYAVVKSTRKCAKAISRSVRAEQLVD